MTEDIILAKHKVLTTDIIDKYFDKFIKDVNDKTDLNANDFLLKEYQAISKELAELNVDEIHKAGVGNFDILLKIRQNGLNAILELKLRIKEICN